MAIGKFWIQRDGILGTAHVSRTGKTVDFRPARILFMSENPSPFFELIATDGWTKYLRVEAQEGKAVLTSTSEDGEWEHLLIPFSAGHLGVRLEYTKESRRLTQLGMQCRDERNAQHVLERALRIELEPTHRVELEAWLDSRLA